MRRTTGIALRNLTRYKRRTILVCILISIGVIAVQVFTSASCSYKEAIISQITDAVLGHIQIHTRGYVASMDNIPLHLNVKPKGNEWIEQALQSTPGIASYSRRIRLGGMLSNYTSTTNIRLYGIQPDDEYATVPLLPKRLIKGTMAFKPGQILVPILLARGMKLNVGDPVVIIATNKDGSVNGMQFTIAGIVETVPGPGGRDGYIHFSDAVELLRMDQPEISEIAVRVTNFNKLQPIYSQLSGTVLQQHNPEGKPVFEIHAWNNLSPFANIAKMIDLMSIFIMVVLISIVLVSIMDVMMMSVFERTREIGTLTAIGTTSGRILSLFITEGALLGLSGAVFGSIFSWVVVMVVNFIKPTFSMGMRRDGFVLEPHLYLSDIVVIGVIVLLVSAVASLQPALKASRIDPIKALKTV